MSDAKALWHVEVSRVISPDEWEARQAALEAARVQTGLVYCPTLRRYHRKADVDQVGVRTPAWLDAAVIETLCKVE